MNSSPKPILILLAFVLFAAYAHSSAVTGGLKKEQPADAEVIEMVRSTHEDIERLAKEKFVSLKPISYREQLVAGKNYFVKVQATTADGAQSYLHVKIYQSLDGVHELGSVLTNQTQGKPIVYFE